MKNDKNVLFLVRTSTSSQIRLQKCKKNVIVVFLVVHRLSWNLKSLFNKLFSFTYNVSFPAISAPAIVGAIFALNRDSSSTPSNQIVRVSHHPAVDRVSSTPPPIMASMAPKLEMVTERPNKSLKEEQCFAPVGNGGQGRFDSW